MALDIYKAQLIDIKQRLESSPESVIEILQANIIDTLEKIQVSREELRNMTIDNRYYNTNFYTAP